MKSTGKLTFRKQTETTFLILAVVSHILAVATASIATSSSSSSPPSISNSSTHNDLAAFDPKDPHYQLHERFPPDKASTWSYGIQDDGWLLAHEGLRGELRDFEEAIDSIIATRGALSSSTAAQQQDETVPSEQHIIQAMQTWWTGHLKHMSSHHRNEDKIAKRFAEQRFRWPDFVEVDHEKIAQQMDAIEELIMRQHCSTGRGNVSSRQQQQSNKCMFDQLAAKLQILWKEYHRVVSRHLDQEEEVCIALMRAYFKQEQVQRMQNRLAMMGPRVEGGAIAYYIGFDKLDESAQRQKTPKLLQLIGMNLILKPRYRFYVKTMVKQLETMKQKPKRKVGGGD